MTSLIEQLIAVYAIIVDTLNPEVASFYQGFDFIPFADQPLTFFLTMDH